MMIVSGVCCGPPWCMVCGDAKPAETVLGDEGKTYRLGYLAYLCCTPVCLVAYVPTAIVSWCFPEAVNVGPFCHCCTLSATLGRGGRPPITLCESAGDNWSVSNEP